jgi:hypothetical protein
MVMLTTDTEVLSVMGAIGWIRRVLSRHANLAVLIGFLCIGTATFASGFSNPFLGDDNPQIVNNLLVHSVSNIGAFFTAGTMYNGGDLTGVFYRPMMTTVYTLICAGLGLNPLPYHVFQLALHVLGAWLCFLIFRYFFKPSWSVIMALIFLVHPINSQSVFAIATLQEPLFVDFGLTGLWVLLRFKSKRALILAGACLLLSLLSKETGILFIGITLAYLGFFDRKRIVWFAAITAGILLVYFALKIHAVGFASNPQLAPIDKLGLVDRLASIPYIILLYLKLFIFPVYIAFGYFSVHSYGSFSDFWLPLVVVINLMLAGAYVGSLLYQSKGRPWFWKYVFFWVWLCLGLGLHLQVIPLDMTASTTWFYLAGIGVLGIVGVCLSAFKVKLTKPVLLGVILIVSIFAMRSAVRGYDWRSMGVIAQKDIAYGEDSYLAEQILAYGAFSAKNYGLSLSYAERSTHQWITAGNSDILGKARFWTGDRVGAKQALVLGMEHQQYYALYEDYARVAILYPEPRADVLVLERGVKLFPRDSIIWLGLAVSKARAGDIAGAKTAVVSAREYGDTSDVREVYDRIMSGKSVD